MTFQFIQLAITNHIATITLNRPDKRNAMNGAMVLELIGAMNTVANDEEAHVLMITANGDHFCAGADIAWMQQVTANSYDENHRDASLLADMMHHLHTFPKPTIVLAHGATMGGGLGLLTAADIAIAADNAVFGFSEVKIGIAPSVISPYAVAAIGERQARYYFLTGEKFDAHTALKLGLIHQLSDNAALLNTGMAIANTLLQNAPHAMQTAKQLVDFVAHQPIDHQVIEKTASILADLRASQEGQEGLLAFIEKRKPNF